MEVKGNTYKGLAGKHEKDTVTDFVNAYQATAL
jgi:hypothetical protein